MTKVFIDGSAGTTGLRIHERICARGDIELIQIPSGLRKDIKTREEAINAADIAFFCLPDEAAVEAAALVHSDVAVIDTSTAHRTAETWTYGFAELHSMRERIAESKRVANPGCHASGFISLVEPLVRAGIIAKETSLSCFSLTGYSGGGKRMIEEYESENRPASFSAPRQYGLPQQHKHLAEMQKLTGIEAQPLFCPIVADYYSGMSVTVPLMRREIKAGIEDIKAVYKAYYTGLLVRYSEGLDEGGMLGANAMRGRDDMEICVFGNEERILLISSFDNLGKGASGAAIQNMNIILGISEDTGLII